MTDTLHKLAERCEAATGPDRELGAAIAEMLGEPWFKQPYTASLDAAMTLAGPGYHLAFDVHFMSDDDCIRYRGYSFRPDWSKWSPHDMDWLNRDGSENPLCATPALALTAAALRARTGATDEE